MAGHHGSHLPAHMLAHRVVGEAVHVEHRRHEASDGGPPNLSAGGPQPGQVDHEAPPPTGVQSSSYSSTTIYPDGQGEAAKHAKRNEHLGELGALAAGAFAVYEEHKVKADPENAGRHHTEATIAGVTALGSGGYAMYEHDQVHTDHKAEAAGKSDHHHGHSK